MTPPPSQKVQGLGTSVEVQLGPGKINDNESANLLTLGHRDDAKVKRLAGC